MVGCLDGVRILELARYQAGPRGGLVLHDMGADVIKVENIEGEELRRMGPFIHDQSVQFAAYNRGKRSVSLNFRHPKALRILRSLILRVDVILENFRPGVMAQMGLGYEDLKKLKPDIILASVSGFGQYGPYRDRQCFDPIAQAMSGIAVQTGRNVGRPLLAEGPIMDRLAALHIAVGILGALHHRDMTGEGQWIEVAMLDMGITLEEVALAMCHHTGKDEFLRGGTFLRCKDGWITAGAARGRMWGSLLKAMGYEELAQDPDFAAPMFATTKGQARMELLIEWAERHTVQEVCDILEKVDVPFGPALSIAQVLQDRHLWEREAMVELPIAEGSDKAMLMPGPTIKMSATPTRLGAIPTVGQHNQAVYGELLGLSQEELAFLRSEGVIG